MGANDYHTQYGSYSDHEKGVYSDRFNDLKEVYLKLKEEWEENRGKKDEFVLNIPKLKLVSLSYLHLLKEYKTFQNNGNKTDNYKRSAYISGLISKNQPIELTNIYVADAMLLGINHHYSIKTLLYYLDIDSNGLENPVIQESIKDILFIYKRKIPTKEIMVTLARCMETISKTA